MIYVDGDNDVSSLWQQYQQNNKQFLLNQVQGFQMQLQQQVMNFWLEFAQANLPQNANDL